MRRIIEMLSDAEARDQQAAEDFVRQLYSPGKLEAGFTEIKEDWILGRFAKLYNELARPSLGGPELVWACRNPRGSSHADFSVYDSDGFYLRDIEVTALFPKPAVKEPKRFEDYWPYPVQPDKSTATVHHVDINLPRKSQPYANLKRVIETHLRDKYPQYWLVIYDNEFWMQDRAQLEGLIRQILQQKQKVRKLPVNLQQVWAFSEGRLVSAWP